MTDKKECQSLVKEITTAIYLVGSNDRFGEAKEHFSAALATLSSGHIVDDGLISEDPNDIERAQVSNILLRISFEVLKLPEKTFTWQNLVHFVRILLKSKC